MIQEDFPKEQVQALRSVHKNLPLNVAALTSANDEIFHVEIHPDPETQKEIVLWDDILQAFNNAVQVRHKTKVVPFLKGKDFTIIQPRRIAAMPNAVLDVVVDDPVVNKEVSSSQERQSASLPEPRQGDMSKIKVEVASQSATPTLSMTSSSSASSLDSDPPSTTSTVRRNPVYGLEEAAMDNYSHIDKPLALPSARGPHELLNDQTPTIENLSISSRPDSGNAPQQRGPQSTTNDTSVELDLAQTSISASQGNKRAQVALGDMYRDGRGIAQNYEAAMDWYLKAVEQGDPNGQHKVGYLYDRGLGVPKDYTQAMAWYLKAAEQGHANSQYNIGVLYDNGSGVAQSYEQAMEWYLKAAIDQGHAKSQYNIGFLYGHGQGVPLDYTQAMEWYLKAADQGHASAQHNIGYFYDNGLGVPQDFVKAAEWYEKSARQGDPESLDALSELKEKGVY